MERLKAFSFKFTDSDLEGLRLVAEHMVATGRMLQPEKANAMRFLIRDYVVTNCPVEETQPADNGKQAA
jgi:hypothetical protein